jgi:hypothetical protein
VDLIKGMRGPSPPIQSKQSLDTRKHPSLLRSLKFRRPFGLKWNRYYVLVTHSLPSAIISDITQIHRTSGIHEMWRVKYKSLLHQNQVCTEFGDVEMISNYIRRFVEVRPDALCHFLREQSCLVAAIQHWLSRLLKILSSAATQMVILYSQRL